jgi:hypothetical protein
MSAFGGEEPERTWALRKRAEKEARKKLGAAIELVQLGNVVTYEYFGKGTGDSGKIRCQARSALQEISLCASDQINVAGGAASTISATPGKAA